MNARYLCMDYNTVSGITFIVIAYDLLDRIESNISNNFVYFGISTTTTSVDIVFVADKNRSFDFFIFSQQWPITRCILLAENNERNVCSAQMFDTQRWTIKGIWPTRIGTKSPAFCTKKKSLRIKQMEPIINELNKYWVNVENDTPAISFWQYEWNKHGTCCAETQLETEDKFFMQGLTWSQQYPINQILEEAGITPGKNYKVIDIHNVIIKQLNKVSSIHCGRTNDGNNYLSEIRLCFSKTLELIDCHVTGNSEMVFTDVSAVKEVVTNCNLHKDIIYPDAYLQRTEYDGNVTNYSWLQGRFQKLFSLLKQTLV